MATTSNAVRQLSDGNSIGTMLGQSSTDVIRFYGAFANTSGVAQMVIVNASSATVLGVASTAVASTGGANNITTWGFTTSSQATMIASTVIALWNLGIIG